MQGWCKVALAVAVNLAWMFVSSYLIILNRHLMVDLKFKYPMFLSGMGMLASGLLSFIACRILRVVDCKAVVTVPFWSTKVLPVGLFTAITLWTGNEVYLYLSVAFIQIFKAFTPVITMMCLFFAGLEEPNRKLIGAVMLLTGGTALAAYGELNLSVMGLLISVASAVSESVRLVMTQYLLTGCKFHPIEGLMYSAPACCLWLYAGSAVREVPKMLENGAFNIIMEHPWQFTGAALMGFMVNLLAFTSIKLSSSLTLKVLGTVKNTLLVVSSVIFLDEVVTLLQAIGYSISLAGFAWYNKIKMTQIAKGSDAKDEGKSLDKEKMSQGVDKCVGQTPDITPNHTPSPSWDGSGGEKQGDVESLTIPLLVKTGNTQTYISQSNPLLHMRDISSRISR